MIPYLVKRISLQELILAKVKEKSDMNLAAIERTVFKRGLPADLEAEKVLLGAVIVNNDLISTLLERLNEEDFISVAHQKIFRSIKELYLNGITVDFVTLKDQIERSKEGLMGIGGVGYLPNLVEGVPLYSNVDHYISLVKEKSILRKLIKKCFEIINSVYNPEEKYSELISLLNFAEKSILEVGEETITSNLRSLSSFSTEIFDTIQSLVKKGDRTTGVPSNFPKLNEMTSGFQNKDLILLAARPSVGKTAFAITLALHAAKKEYSVAFFSLEMSKEQLYFRMISQEAQIELSKIRSGYLSKENISKVQRAIDKISGYPIFIDDTPSLTVLDIGAKLRRLKSNGKIDLVIIDYIQLMTGRGLEGIGKSKFENRNQEVAAISRALKMLAKEIDLPIIALSQLSRAPEKRSDSSEPLLSDLRDSGSLEQDADLVLFLHRPHFGSKGKSNKDKEISTDDKSKAFLIIAKQRNGPTGSIRLVFREEYTLFTPFSPIEE